MTHRLLLWPCTSPCPLSTSWHFFRMVFFLSSLPILAHSIPGLYPSSARGRQISPSLSIGARARLMKIGYYTFAELWSYNNRFLSYIQNFSPFLMGSNPPTDSSKPASVDQFWKIFADIKETDVNCTDMNRKGVSKGGGGSAVLTVLGEIVELTWSEDEEKRRLAGTHLYSWINWGTVRFKLFPKIKQRNYPAGLKIHIS